MNDEKITLKSGEESNKYVLDMFDDIQKIINEKISKIHREQQWLILARVINLLIANFYSPILSEVSKKDTGYIYKRGVIYGDNERRT